MLELNQWRARYPLVEWVLARWDKWITRKGHRNSDELTCLPPLPLTIKKRRQLNNEQEPSVTWNFRTHLLDRLDEYFQCLRQMRRYDNDAYELYSRIGLQVPSNAMVKGTMPLTDQDRVTFGGMLFGQWAAVIETVRVLPGFMYFTKLKHPTRVQWFRGDVYEVTIIYDASKKPGAGGPEDVLPLRYHVGVDDAGNALLLKEKTVKTSTVQPRRGRSISMRYQVWDYPCAVKGIAEEHPEDFRQWAVDVFRSCYLTTLASQRKIIVRVKQNKLTAAFGIDAPTAKVFFKDRDATALARDGKRKRIFHHVRAHPRINLVHTDEVKAHYKGLRHFDWLGYRVGIVFPSRNFLLRFNCPAELAEDLALADTQKAIDSIGFGNQVDELLST